VLSARSSCLRRARLAAPGTGEHNPGVLRRCVAAVVVGFLCLVVACGPAASGPATVHGLLIWPAGSRPEPLTPVPTAGTVEILRGPHVVGRVTVDPSGRFTLRLLAGTYVLKGAPGALNPGGYQSCQTRHPVQVRSGEVVSVHVDCHYNGPAPG